MAFKLDSSILNFAFKGLISSILDDNEPAITTAATAFVTIKKEDNIRICKAAGITDPKEVARLKKLADEASAALAKYLKEVALSGAKKRL